MNFLKKYKELEDDFKENHASTETDIINMPIHPSDNCDDCHLCEDDEKNDVHDISIECEYCQSMFRICVENQIEKHINPIILDYTDTNYGRWDSSDLFKVKWIIDNKEIYGLIHFAIYYDPNAWNKNVRNAGDWYKIRNMVTVNKDKNDELFAVLKNAKDTFYIIQKLINE
jgi:hypothetical protein